MARNGRDNGPGVAFMYGLTGRRPGGYETEKQRLVREAKEDERVEKALHRHRRAVTPSKHAVTHAGRDFRAVLSGEHKFRKSLRFISSGGR